jgi:uncharacterized protein
MAVTPTYPGVYIQELPSAVHPITGVATSIGAFVGYTARGIDNRAEHIYSFGDYERLFGGLASDSEVSYAVQQFFGNGGTEAYVVRTPRANAKDAGVEFGPSAAVSLAFAALSSGAWANGELTIDVDYNGLAQAVAGTMKVVGTAVTGTNTSFTTALKKDQFLVFANDPSQTPFQIHSVNSDTSITLASAFGGPATATTATVTNDPTAFNLTITNLVDGTVEKFPNVSLNSSLNSYITNVVNDFDNGSQLVNVTVAGVATAAPAQTGIVGSAILAATVATLLAGSTAVASPVTVTFGSSTVAGTGLGALTVGQLLMFASDPTETLYTIASIAAAGTSLTLSTSYTGASAIGTTATVVNTTPVNDFGLQLSVTSPAIAPLPLPISLKVFAAGSPVPLTVSGLATQLQRAINGALAVQMRGASVQCSVSGIGVNQSIRVNAMIPQFPDAVLAISAPSGASGLHDCSTDLGLSAPTSNVAHYVLGSNNGSSTNGWGGFQISSTPGSDGTGLPDSNSLIGDQGLFTGIYALERVDIFNLLCIPEATRAAAGNPSLLDTTVDPNAIYSAAVALCDSRRAFLLVDCPPFVNTPSSAVDWISTGLTVSDANGAAFFPRLRLADSLNNFQLRTFAPCGVVAGLYARIDASRGVWKAPAGTEASLAGVQSLVYPLNDAENGTLNPLGLNCFRTFPVYKSVLWGSRTLLGADAFASQWKYVPVRRVALYLEESLYRGTKWVVFEPNDEPLWSAIRLNVGAFMHELFIKNYFQGQTPAQAYFVKCDSDTTTQTDIDNGVVNIVVGFAPLLPAEFVIIQIQQMAGQIAI